MLDQSNLKTRGNRKQLVVKVVSMEGDAVDDAKLRQPELNDEDWTVIGPYFSADGGGFDRIAASSYPFKEGRRDRDIG